MLEQACVSPIDRFSGDFDVLPIMAHFRYGQVPVRPTSDDFQLTACLVESDLDVYAEAHWFLEAVRERRLHPARPLEDAKREIASRVARRLYDRIFEVSQ